MPFIEKDGALSPYGEEVLRAMYIMADEALMIGGSADHYNALRDIRALLLCVCLRDVQRRRGECNASLC